MRSVTVRRRLRRIFCGFGAALLLACASAFAPAPAHAIEKPGEELQEVKISPRLGEVLDPNLTFTDSTGKTALLKDFARAERPFIVVPVYYNCPRLCGFLLDGVTKLIGELDLLLGTDYTILTVSFAATESTQLAAKRKEKFLNDIGNPPGAMDGWRFLVGTKQHIDPLMTSLGFGYKPDGEDFAHGAALFVLTPHGEISQYFTGIDFSPKDVRLALVEASKGRIGSAIDQILLFCFRFDHTQGKYTWAVVNVIRVVGALTLLFLVSLIYFLYRGARGTSEPTRAV